MRDMILPRLAAEEDSPIVYKLRCGGMSRLAAFQMFVKTMDPVGRPAAAAFEKGKPNVRILLEHVAVEQRGERDHVGDRHGDHMRGERKKHQGKRKKPL